MSEAAALAWLSTRRDAAKPGDAECEAMALQLSRLVAVYALSPSHEQIRTLTASDLRGGRFAERGDAVRFDDGRAPITGLCMTRAALNAAIKTLKSAPG